jgi:hypothetical protein
VMAISDVLFDAVNDIDRYLTDDPWDRPWRERILAVRAAMDGLRAALDAPPPPAPRLRLRVLDGGRA